MCEIKILHMADIHFGRAVSGLPARLRDIRRQEVRSAFAAAIAIAKERGADAVLISGDLFDKPEVDKKTISFIAGELAKIPHIPVLVSPGNHDPLGAAYDALIAAGCPNLTVFGSECSCAVFPEKNFAVHGIGFDNGIINEPLLKKFKADNRDMINIAVVHGDVSAQSDYNPINEGDIAATGMNYIALGHVHSYSGIQKSGSTFYAYCGTPEGGGFDECGDKGVVFGSVSETGCSLEFVPVCRRRYWVKELDVTGTDSLQEIIERVGTITENKDDLYKIIFTGQRPEKIPPQVIENEAGVFFIKTEDLTRGAYNLEEISGDYTLAGIFAGNVLARMDGAGEEERAELRRAADIVLDILDS